MLWRAVVERTDDFLIGYHSWFDARPVTFVSIPKCHDLIDSVRTTRAVAKLVWFTQNWFVCEKTDGAIRFHDLRFGRAGLYDGSWIFSWRIIHEDGETRFVQSDRLGRITGDHVTELWRRVNGN